MEYLCKVNQGVADGLRWRDGQIIDKREDGFHEGGLGNGNWGRHKKSLVVIRDTEDYWTARGSTDWKSTLPQVLEFKKHLAVSHQQGAAGFSGSFSNGFKQTDHKHPWEGGYIEPGPEIKYPRRDFFIDYQELLDEGHITQAQYDSIYEITDHLDIILPFALSTSGLIHHERQFRRR